VTPPLAAGLSETLEVQEMYQNLQEEQLDNLKDDLVSCIDGEEGQGGVCVFVWWLSPTPLVHPSPPQATTRTWTTV
jgi:hypothetical protein